MAERDAGHHWVLAGNGVAGACAAAMVLMRHPDAAVRITSPRHLPLALDELLDRKAAGTVHICGMGQDADPDAVLPALGLLRPCVKAVWYAGRPPGDLLNARKAFTKVCEAAFFDCATDAEAVFRYDRIEPSERANLLLALAEEAAQERPPQNELHRLWHRRVKAANYRFYLFGDDALNHHLFRVLAGLENPSKALDAEAKGWEDRKDPLFPLGSSPAMKALRHKVGKMGPVPEPVLILGPTGAGKEVLARALHLTSGRTGAFVAENCGVIGGNPELAEDRLFGHVRGAFTGAERERKGAFEQASGGTLFLDEVGELGLPVQVHLLRVLEEARVQPVGSHEPRTVDVRIVTATHRDLVKMVNEGTFREDLYYRLNVLALNVPPLRERPDDMRSIAHALEQKLAVGGYTLRLGPEDWQAVRAYAWPGNVRQFINLLKRSAYLGVSVRETIAEEWGRTTHDPGTGNGTGPWDAYAPSAESVVPEDEVRKAYLQHVHCLFDGHTTRAAKALGISPNTLRRYV